MTKASLTIENLKQVYQTSGAISITKLLGKKVNGKSVITSHEKLITKIFYCPEKN